MIQRRNEIKHLLSMGVLFTFVVSMASGSMDEENNIRKYAEFAAGCYILNRIPAANLPQRKELYYKRLITITGISAERMLVFLESIRNNPRRGKKIYDLVSEMLSKESSVLK